MKKTHQALVNAYWLSPLGLIHFAASDAGITHIGFVDQGNSNSKHNDNAQAGTADKPWLTLAVTQMQEYFAGQRSCFDLPLAPVGTAFQEQVWAALQSVDYGRTASYRDIAQAIGKPKAVRAVGAANGKNPIAIVVPCHRVIGSNGSLTGYAGGLERKQWLLAHEVRAGVAGFALG